jgi:hypothetical protein
MKKCIYSTMILFIVSFGAIGQEKLNEKECDFLSSLHFKNGKATVIVKAIYKEINRSGAEPIFANLEKKKKLRLRDYFTRCCGGGEIVFMPEHCSKMYRGVMIQKKMNFNINLAKDGDVLYLSCVVYEGEKDFNNLPLFTVNDISNKRVGGN